MKVALISPKSSFSNIPKIQTEFHKFSKQFAGYRYIFSGFGLSLLTVAALMPKSFDITLIDESFDKIDFNEDYDLVGITAFTQQANRAYRIARKFKNRGVKVIIGGIHATVLPGEAKQYSDSVIVGEAEPVFSGLIKDFLRNELKPFYKSNKQFDLTKSPLPRYDLLKPDRYKVMWVQTTRGCPFDCEFCAASKVWLRRD